MSRIKSVRITAHPTSDEHWIAIIAVGRFEFCATYAGDRPAEDKVRSDWNEDGGLTSKNWKPYRGY